MPTDKDAGSPPSSTSNQIDRRTVIERSLGLALAGSVLGVSTELAAAMSGTGRQSATPPFGIALPNGMRRIVTGHDAEGKSYIVSDERVAGAAFPNLFKTSGDDPFGPGPVGESRELRATDSPRLEPDVGGASFVFVTLPPTRPGTQPRTRPAPPTGSAPRSPLCAWPPCGARSPNTAAVRTRGRGACPLAT